MVLYISSTVPLNKLIKIVARGKCVDQHVLLKWISVTSLEPRSFIFTGILYTLSFILYPQSFYLLSSIFYLLSSILLSSIFYLLSSIFYLLSSIFYPLSYVFYLLSAIIYLLSSIFYFISSIFYFLSIFNKENVIRPLACQTCCFPCCLQTLEVKTNN